MSSSSLRCVAASILAFALAGCGGGGGAADDDDDDDDTAIVDAAVADAAAPGIVDAAVCGAAIPTPDPDWIQAYEEEIVAKLSGTMEIAAGVTLTDRQSPAARTATRAFLLAELTALGYEPEEQAYEFATPGANVVATLAADLAGDGGGVIVVGAHFDGVQVGPAAADDGTGVALVLATARWLRTVGCRGRDVIFALFDQEESGLIGSTRFVEAAIADEMVIDEMHNFDMISWDENGDRAIELWKAAPELQAAYQAAAAARGTEVSLAPTFAASDHQAFIERGIPAVGVSEQFVAGDSTPYYHTAEDTYDKVDFAYLASATAIANLVLGQRVEGSHRE